MKDAATIHKDNVRFFKWLSRFEFGIRMTTSELEALRRGEPVDLLGDYELEDIPAVSPWADETSYAIAQREERERMSGSQESKRPGQNRSVWRHPRVVHFYSQETIEQMRRLGLEEKADQAEKDLAERKPQEPQDCP